jgi:hypothetical protein
MAFYVISTAMARADEPAVTLANARETTGGVLAMQPVRETGLAGRTRQCTALQGFRNPGPRRTLPGKAFVIMAPSITGTPLTRTYCIPTAS